jgi:F-type H+-transporting ATPase subunit a
MTIYAPLENLVGIPAVFQAAVLAAVLLLVSGVLVRRRLAACEDEGLLPDDGFTLRNALEVLVDGLASLARDVIGPEYRTYFPIVATIFIFILVSNLMGLIPALGGATSDANTTWAWAIISFAVYNFVGIRKHGWRYVLQFCGPSFDIPLGGGRHAHFPVLFWFFFPLEIPLHLARMLTLAVRLLANMFADHLVVSMWISLVPFVVPVVFLGLGTMVGVIQAFVFSLLTMTYIGMALEEPH